MPELPEVETIRRILDPELSGLRISRIRISSPSVIAYPSPEEFSRRLEGQALTGTSRRGKYLILGTEGGDRVIIHLRMTGCLLLVPSPVPAEKHTHAVFILDDGRELRFSDTRRFGRLWLIGCGEDDSFTGIAKLGPEPFDPIVSGGYLSGRLGRSRRAIKECLMDQSVIAGIGNIYSDEILFRAKIAPGTEAIGITKAEWAALASIIPECLSFFVEKNAISLEDHARTKGREYRNTPYLQVYGHAGEPCPVCGTELAKAVIGGRSSVYCPSCQKRR